LQELNIGIFDITVMAKDFIVFKLENQLLETKHSLTVMNKPLPPKHDRFFFAQSSPTSGYAMIGKERALVQSYRVKILGGRLLNFIKKIMPKHF